MLLALVASATLSLLSACGGDAEAGDEPLVVFAAASLADVFPAIEPDARYSFAGSDELAAQIREGAPADVFASASPAYTDELVAAGVLDEAEMFATNRLVLAVPRDNPAGIERVDDVARPGVRLVVAAETVPAGRYTREALSALGLDAALENVVSNEDDVRGVLAKVRLGEADAGFVYSTDAAVAGDEVSVIELPQDVQPAIAYTIGVVSGSERGEAARAFVELVLSFDAQAALREAGFGPPDSP